MKRLLPMQLESPLSRRVFKIPVFDDQFPKPLSTKSIFACYTRPTVVAPKTHILTSLFEIKQFF